MRSTRASHAKVRQPFTGRPVNGFSCELSRGRRTIQSILALALCNAYQIDLLNDFYLSYSMHTCTHTERDRHNIFVRSCAQSAIAPRQTARRAPFAYVLRMLKCTIARRVVPHHIITAHSNPAQQVPANSVCVCVRACVSAWSNTECRRRCGSSDEQPKEGSVRYPQC